MSLSGGVRSRKRRGRGAASGLVARGHAVEELTDGFDVEVEEEVVAPHRGAAIADVRASLRLPEIPPELPAVARVERPDVIAAGIPSSGCISSAFSI